MTRPRTAFAARIEALKQHHGHNWWKTKTVADQEINPENGTPNCRVEESAMKPETKAAPAGNRGLRQHLVQEGES